MKGVSTPHMLNPGECHALLRAYGIPVPRQRVVTTADEVRSAARELGGPVVIKAIAPGLVHKSDAGGVELGVACPDHAHAAERAPAQ